MLRPFAACCRVLQSVAVVCFCCCLDVLQSTGACCSVLQRVVECCRVLQFCAIVFVSTFVCCSVLQRVAACCRALWRDAKCCTSVLFSLFQHLVCYRVLQCVAVC